MRFEVSDIAMEGYKGSTSPVIGKLKSLSPRFEQFVDMIWKIKITDGEPKDKFEEGPTGVKAPSSVEVGKRTWQFYRVLKDVAAGKKVNTTQELNALYEKHVDAEFRGSKGYKLKGLDYKEIVFPKSGWFSFPVVQIERALRLFPERFDDMVKHLESLEGKEANEYAQVIDKLITDIDKVIIPESVLPVMYLARKVKKK